MQNSRKSHPFKAIVVFVANDIHGGDDDRSPREMLQLYQSLVENILSRNPETPVFWIETTPTPSRWNVNPKARKANKLIRDWSGESEDLHFISTFDAFMTPEPRSSSPLLKRRVSRPDIIISLSLIIFGG